MGITAWNPRSWRALPALQQPEYPDPGALEHALAELRGMPPLVTSWEIVLLREQLAEAALGRRFVLQGGDCAERFADCTSPHIANMLKVLLQMSLVLVVGAKRPVTRIGRFAGQYAKPRSSPAETRDGVTLPSYRGDLINSAEFTRGGAHARSEPAAARLRTRGPDAQFHPRAGEGRVRRPAPPRVLRPRMGPEFAHGRRVSPAGEFHLRFAAVHGERSGGPCRRKRPHRLLHRP